LNADKLQDAYDLILIVRKPALTLKYKEMEASVMHVLRRAGLLKGGTPGAQGEGKKPSGGMRRRKAQIQQVDPRN